MHLSNVSHCCARLLDRCVWLALSHGQNLSLNNNKPARRGRNCSSRRLEKVTEEYCTAKTYVYQVAVLEHSWNAAVLGSITLFSRAKDVRRPWICRREAYHERRFQNEGLLFVTPFVHDLSEHSCKFRAKIILENLTCNKWYERSRNLSTGVDSCITTRK